MDKFLLPPPSAAQAAAGLVASGVDPLIALVLARRGIATPADAQRVLRAERWGDVPHLDRAAGALRGVIRRGDPIAVFGDYDADGVIAAAIAARAIERAGGRLSAVVIPDREGGYGITPTAAAELILGGARAVVAVDNGTGARQVAALCALLGVPFIVLDHHQHDAAAPGAADAGAIVVNPRLVADAAPHAAPLTAAGLAYELHRALIGDDAAAMALAAIATIADVASAAGNNRWLIRHGLAAAPEAVAQAPGLAALLEAAGVSPDGITPWAVGWKVAPLLNAAGRMGAARRAYDLLRAGDPAQAQALAQALVDANAQREQETLRAEAALFAQLQAEGAQGALVWAVGDYPLGLHGVLAARALDKSPNARIAVVGALTPQGVRASVRGGFGTDVGGVLTALVKRGTLIAGGGHARAGGFTADPACLAEVRAALAEAAEAAALAGGEARTWRADLVLAPEEWGKAASNMDALAPFLPGDSAWPVPRAVLDGGRVAVSGRAVIVRSRDGREARFPVGDSCRPEDLARADGREVSVLVSVSQRPRVLSVGEAVVEESQS